MPNWKKVIVSGSDAALNSLNVSTAFTASGLRYPATDGTAGYVLATNGSGVLSFTSSSISASYAIFAETASSSLNAQDILVYVKNQSGYNIGKGVVVHVTASGNSSDIPRIVTASYLTDAYSANTLGITNQAISNGAEGYVMTEGVLKGIDTTGFVSGQMIYLGASGSIIGTAPTAPLHSVRLGQIIREQSNNGSIYVRIDNGYELGELHDVVDTSTSTSYGDLLVKSGSVWTNSKQLTGSYAITGSLTATSFAGSLFGTASWATNALTASYTPAIAGTDNYIPRFNGTSALENSVMYDDGTNIGIGTSSPVSYSGYTSLTIGDNSGTKIGLLKLRSNYNSGNGAEIYQNGSGLIYINTNSGTTAMNITAAGNIGIGTTNPGAPLHVFTSDISNSLQISGYPSSGNPLTFLESNYGALNAVKLKFLNYNPSNGYDSDFGIQLMNTSQAMNDVFIIKGSTGNVGIGNTSPNQKLEISVGNGNTGGLRINYASTATSEGMDITYLNTGATVTSFDSRYNSNNAVMQFRMKTTGTPVTAMTILGNGLIGIGTTSPVGRLTLKSPGDVSTAGDGFIFQRNSNTAKLVRIYESAADGFLEVRDGGDTIVSKLSGYSGTPGFFLSDIGIGTNSPSYKLDVSGSIRSNQQILAGSSITTSSESTLILGPAPAGGSGEGGQIALQPGSGYTSGSFLDNYQNKLRILRGTAGATDAEIAAFNLHTKQLTLPAYNSTTAFTGTVAGILAFDSSGNILTTTASAGGGGGSGTVNSGTAGYLAYYPSTGTTVDDTSGVYWDAGNSRLAVGNSSPSYKVDVTGDIRATGAIYANANGAMYFQGGDDVALHDINVANTLGVYGQQDSTVGSIKLGSGGGVISGYNGNIGIGITNPAQKLDVSGSIHVQSSSTVGTIYFGNTNQNYISYSDSDSYYRANGAHYFEGSGFYKGIWNADGNLGVGTTSVSGNSTNRVVSIVGADSANLVLTETGGAAGSFTSYGNELYIGASTNHPFYLYTNNTERMRITAAGNVGIGTSSPTNALELAADKTLRIDGSSASNDNYGLSIGGYGFFRIDAPGVTGGRFIVNNAGNVGIGSSSPGRKLDVNGKAIFYNAGVSGTPYWNNNSVEIQSSGGGTVALEFHRAGYSSATIFSDDGAIGFNTDSGTERMRILGTSGNVGIGITNPAQKLHVAGNLRVTGAIYDSNNAAGSSGQVLSSTGTGTDWVSLSEITGVDGTGTANYVTKWSDTDTVTNSVIYDTGTNIGVGTTSPYSGTGVRSIDINASSYPLLALSVSGTLVGSLVGYSGYTILGTKSGNYLVFAPDDTERMRITAAGSVGIGTTNPVSELHVHGTSTEQFSVSYDSTRRMIIGRTTGYGWILPYTSGVSYDNLVLARDGGNVGIGITNPSYKLDVAGTFGTSGDATFNGTNTYINSSNIVVGNDTSDVVGIAGNTMYLPGTNQVLINGNTNSNTRYMYDSYVDGNSSYYQAPPALIRLDSAASGSIDQAPVALFIHNENGSNNTWTKLSLGSREANGSGNSVSVAGIAAHKTSGAANSWASGDLYLWTKNTGTQVANMVLKPSGNVGIGVTNPNTTLEVNKNVTFSSIDTYAQLVVKTTSGANGKLLNIGVDESAGLSFIQSLDRGTDSMPLILQRYSGNVGIGITNPTEKLAVNGNIETVEPYGKIGFNVGDAYGDYPHYGLGKSSGSNPVNLAGYYGVTFGTAGSERMRINGSGDVLVGTTTSIWGTSGRGIIQVNGSSTALIGLSTGDTASGYLYHTGTNFYISNYKNGDLYLLTNDNTRLTVLSGGGILMNTSTSSTSGGFTNTTLNIKQLADGSFGGGLQIEEAATTSLAYFGFNGTVFNIGTSYRSTGAYRPITFSTNGSERVRIDNDGNVGIGTTNPGQKLEVNGNIKLSSTAGQTSTPSYIWLGNDYSDGTTRDKLKVYLYNSGTEKYGFGVGSSGDIQYHSNAYHDFYIGNTFSSRLNSTGLAVGTTSAPGNRLIVAQDTGYTNENTYTIAAAASTNTAYKLIMGYDYSQDIGVISAVHTGVAWKGLSIVPNGGNVGIGTTAASAKLDVNGGSLTIASESSYALRVRNGSSKTVTIGADSSYAYIQSFGSGPLQINNQGNNVLFNANGGSVGIGTTNPSQTLHVAGNLRVTGAIYDSNNSAGSSGEILTSTGTGTDWVSLSSISGVDGSGTANYVPKWTDADTIGNSAIYDNSGNIGIGTTNPGAKLEVVGTFRATTKSFLINHPTKEGKKLQYGVLEGPEHSVYVRGKLTGTRRIELPDYWHALVDEDSITVNLTAIGRGQQLWVEEITDTYIMVGSDSGIVNCFYTVFAERKDVDKLITEFDKE